MTRSTIDMRRAVERCMSCAGDWYVSLPLYLLKASSDSLSGALRAHLAQKVVHSYAGGRGGGRGRRAAGTVFLLAPDVPAFYL